MDSRDDSWRRRREREDEEEEQASSLDRTKDRTHRPSSGIHSSSVPQEKFNELMGRAEPMIEQLNHLYQMYALGTEKLPPLERRKQLDQLMTSLQLMAKPTPATQFRFNSLQSQYHSYVDRWEKLMKDLESGKLKRVTGPKKGSF